MPSTGTSLSSASLILARYGRYLNPYFLAAYVEIIEELAPESTNTLFNFINIFNNK